MAAVPQMVQMAGAAMTRPAPARVAAPHGEAHRVLLVHSRSPAQLRVIDRQILARDLNLIFVRRSLAYASRGLDTFAQT
jgi:hypothetical protein